MVHSLKNEKETFLTKPFLKWAGGKSQLLSQFKLLYPQALEQGEIKNYYEPFLGSGAVFFDIIQRYNVGNAWLYDANPNLILTYQCIQEHAQDLIEELIKIQTLYHKKTKDKQAEYFYTQRTAYNQQIGSTKKDKDTLIKRAVQFIFLNRTCFNGLYRVNAKGEFNTPAGKYNNPLICDADNLMAVSALLQKALIKNTDYTALKKDLKNKSFIYFDPPYRPLNKTASFNSYAKEVFNDENQKQLASFFSFVTEKGALAMLSNSDPKNHDKRDDFFDKLYQSYFIKRIPARRLINANADKRGNINEIVVTNYKI